MVPSLPLLSCESSVPVKKTLMEKKNRAKTFSNEIYTICSFLRKHSDALVSAHGICSFTNIATDREDWQKLKKLIICAAKADKTYVNLL